MTFSPFNRQNQGGAQTAQVQQNPQTSVSPAVAQATAYVPRNTFTAAVPQNYENINFGPGGLPELPDGDHLLELVPGDPKKDPGAETGRWFYAPPGKSKDAKIIFKFKVIESTNASAVGQEYGVRQKLAVNSQGSDDIVFKKIASILFPLIGIGQPTVQDKRDLVSVWDEFMAQGTMSGQTLIGCRCRARVYDSKNVGAQGRPYKERDFRPV